ncbi:MAG TPA: hypothetical protein GXZ74_05980 [Tissierellia bacterium]|nr:hypothetical protein [Tissierellia bacterium]
MNNRRQDILKIVAMVTMLIDHIGLLFFPEEPTFRLIGRVAFPLYAYFIAQGFRYTRSRPRYFLRLLLFGLIAQVPFGWLNEGAIYDPWQVNQIPMLLYGALVLVVLEQGKKAGSGLRKSVFILVSLVLAFVPEWLMVEIPKLSLHYGTYGILLIMLFYWFDRRWPELITGFIGLAWFYPYRYFAQWSGPEGDFFSSWTNFRGIAQYYKLTASSWISFSQLWNQNNALFSLPIIYLAQQLPTKLRLNKWLAYWFYPGHIALLVLIYHLFVK